MTKQWTSYRARFQGALAGIKVQDLTGLDYDIEKYKDRLNFIVNKIDEVEPFLNEYFFPKSEEDDEGKSKEIKYFNYSPNTKDELSLDINICKFIEQYGSYILNSKDLARDKQQEYTILSEEDFKKQLNKEMSTTADATLVLDTRPSNDYTNLALKITKKDLQPELQNNKYGVRAKDLYLAAVLNDYNILKEHLKNELRNIQLGVSAKYDLIKIRSLLADINDDMLMCKDKILALKAPAKRLGDETPYNDYSTLDYNNKHHLRAIMKNCKMTTPRPDDMSSHIGYDLMNGVNKLRKSKKIDKIDLEIIECYNSGNYTLEQIGKEVGMKKQSVDYRINRICEKLTGVM
ncbi:hypothetical protein [Terrisporobacter sp.]|uniref:hypothetical protein n=1 Tax=Terrisporobacter sp. TaxID=1965305 RepID=UPI003992644A